MRFNHSTFVLRMELYPDEPFVSRNLDDFGQSAFRLIPVVIIPAFSKSSRYLLLNS